MTPRIKVSDTVLITPQEYASKARPWGYVLDLTRSTPAWIDLAALAFEFRNWRAHAEILAMKVCSEIRLDPNDLNDSLIVNRYLRRGYLLDAALARRLDEIYPPGGFLAALRQSWDLTIRQASHSFTPRQRDKVVAFYVQQYIAQAEADHNGGFREDKIADRIRGDDPAQFPQFNETDLGKTLSRLGIGTVQRHGVYEDAKRKFRSFVYLSDDDRQRLREVTHGL